MQSLLIAHADPSFLLAVLSSSSDPLFLLKSSPRLSSDRSFVTRVLAISPTPALQHDLSWISPSLLCDNAAIRDHALDLVRSFLAPSRRMFSFR
jgi:hypothetical protein